MPRPVPVEAVTVYVVPLPVTEVTVPPLSAPVRASAKSAASTPVTASLKVTVQLTLAALLGLAPAHDRADGRRGRVDQQRHWTGLGDVAVHVAKVATTR